MIRKALLGAMAAYVLAGGGLASAGDHLNCFKVKDPLPKQAFSNVTLISNTGRPTESGCLIKVPAKVCCDAVDKLGVPPQPGGAGKRPPTSICGSWGTAWWRETGARRDVRVKLT